MVTEYRMREAPIRPKDYKEWKFNWSITEKEISTISSFNEGKSLLERSVCRKMQEGIPANEYQKFIIKRITGQRLDV